MKTILLFLLIPSVLLSQNFKQQRNNMIIYNISLGAVIGGFSELIANPRKDKPIKAFLHGFCMGGLGGGINGFGKIAIGEVISKKYYGLVLPTRIISSLGNSIVYNTGHSKNLYFQYFNFDYGYIQIQVDCINKTVIPKLSPMSILGTYLALKDIRSKEGVSLNLGRSLTLGIPYFNNDSLKPHEHGYTYMSTITMNSNSNDSSIASSTAHEFIHVLQYYEYTNLSNMVFGKIGSYKDNKKIWKIVNIDLPYNDIFYSLYTTFSSTKGFDQYYNNFYEREARNFANQRR